MLMQWYRSNHCGCLRFWVQEGLLLQQPSPESPGGWDVCTGANRPSAMYAPHIRVRDDGRQ